MKISALLAAGLLLLTTSCQQKKEKLLLGGSGWNKVVILDKETKTIEWEYPLENGWECNSVAMTDNGNILFSYSKGAKLVTEDKKEIWNISAPEGCEMQTARILPDGNFLLAWCGTPAKVMEVNSKGEIISETSYETGIEQAHAQFRQVNKNKEGNYLFPLFATSDVREVNAKGELLKSVNVGGTPFSLMFLPNGNYLVACGDGHKYVELNFATGEIVKSVEQNDIEGAKLFFVAQLYPSSNGGYYICNWQGHDSSATEGNYPQLIEVDKDGKKVWELNDNATFGMISSVYEFSR